MFLVAMSLVFIVVELRTRFDKSFLIFGITNLLLSFFCAIDIWFQPTRQTIPWTRIQHIIAAFFPALILWYLMILLRKINAALICALFVIGGCFSLLFLTNFMIKPSEKEVMSTFLYDFTFAPFMVGSIIYILLFSIKNFFKNVQSERRLLFFHIVGSMALSIGGFLDMISVFVGYRIFSFISSWTMLGFLIFGFFATYAFIHRLTGIIKSQGITFEKLQEAYKELNATRPLSVVGRSVAMINHEIKNKTYSLSLLLSTLRIIPLPARAKEKLDDCDTILSSIIKFNKDIIEQSGVSHIRMEQVDVCACIKKTIESSIRTQRCFIRYEGPHSGLVVLGDKTKLHSVFENLINNGIQAGASEIIVRCCCKDDMISIDFEDNGKGCDEESFKMLFTAFFTTKSKYHSTGLGLCIVQTIIENHYGQITAASKNLSGKGRTGMIFSITLPTIETQRGKKPMPA
jgi:signal transduction histidine kinase